MYPSEYAFRDGSISRAESSSANCRRYQSGLLAPPGVFPEQYTHCDGMQRKLTDSDLGQEQYRVTDYYQWSAGSNGHLLFIFLTRVSLTTITLYYYTDSYRGLSGLRFYAVSDNFNVWNSPTTSYPHVDVAGVPPGEEPAGRRNVSINVNFNTSRVLMYKYTSSFVFSVSEVEFFICTSKYIATPSFYICM